MQLKCSEPKIVEMNTSNNPRKSDIQMVAGKANLTH